MKTEILQRPANTIVKLELNAGEELTAEGGSMVAMSPGLSVETTTHKRGKRSLRKAGKRLLAGESLFMNHYKCEADKATLFLAPTLSGDIVHRPLENGKTLIVQGSSFVAHWGNVDMDMKWQGFKSLIAKEGMFWIKLSGSGELLLNAFGAIYPVDVDGEYIVDTGHIVAFEEGLDFKLSKAGSSWMGSFMGGEGFVARFKGKGRLWCQSHNQSAFGYILGPMLRPR
tara:strand:- start:3383 stop:4063 length:681 start_codon:yes stop_codon:yes gene_type:complete